MQKQNHNQQNKIALINDFSGFGRCSITVALPIISRLKIQCCPVPTSIFSNHTAFPDFFFDDYTEKMTDYIDEWKKLDLRFEGILTGFLGSKEQLDIVARFIRDFRDERTTVVIDPVMGDNGKPYYTYTEEMCDAMRHLVEYADILTPNLTEACILSQTKYDPEHMTRKDLYRLVDELARRMKSSKSRVVITGVVRGCYIENIVRTEDGEHCVIKSKRVGKERSGTGDVYSAIIAADAVHHVPFPASVRRASDFIKRCILATEEYGEIPASDGVCFEDVLDTLKP